MELNDLRSNWQNAGTAAKTEAELLHMTKIMQHPTLKKIRVKLLMEIILLVFFSFIYYDWFDGEKKPLYANIVLITGLALYIINDVIGYAALIKPVNGLNLKLSIAGYVTRIKRLAVLSVCVCFLYSAAIIVFFTSVIHFTREKRFLLLALVIVLSQMVFWSGRIWMRKIKKLDEQLKDLNES